MEVTVCYVANLVIGGFVADIAAVGIAAPAAVPVRAAAVLAAALSGAAVK